MSVCQNDNKRQGPDGFLRRFFQLQERSAAPRCVSAEATIRGTFEAARSADLWRLWALGVMRQVEAAEGARAVDVARRYYLGLSNAHFSIVARTGGAVTARAVGGRETPDEAADLQSFCDWRRMAVDVLGQSTPAAQRACRDALTNVRLAVAEELRRREDEEPSDDGSG